MTASRVLWAVIVFQAVTAFSFAAAGLVAVAGTIAVGVFLTFTMTVLLNARATAVSSNGDTDA